MKRTMLMLAIVLFVTGCGTHWSPEARLLASRDTFNTTLNVVTDAIEAGKFTDDEAKQILFVAKAAQTALDRYDAAVRLGQPTTSLIRQFNLLLREMIAYQIVLERRAKDDTG